METEQEGEQMVILTPADLPTDPSFPARPLMAAAGLGVGLGLGVLLAIWMEFSERVIRTEKDVAGAMDLPMLVSMPWLGMPDGSGSLAGGNGKRRFWSRGSPADEVKIEA